MRVLFLFGSFGFIFAWLFGPALAILALAYAARLWPVFLVLGLLLGYYFFFTDPATSSF